MRSKNNPRPGGRNGIVLFLAFIGLLNLMYLAPAIFALMSVGLAPSLVTWLADQNPLRVLRVRIIFLFNISGVIPVAVDLWSSGRGFTAALDLLADVMSWLIMYGAAGLGMVAIWLAPQISALITKMIFRERLRTITKQQDKLVEDWGPDISPSVPARAAESASPGAPG